MRWYNYLNNIYCEVLLMNEVKKPKKPLIFYYAIVLLILLFFNFLGMPLIAEHSVQEVNYNTFVEMAANGEIGSV